MKSVITMMILFILTVSSAWAATVTKTSTESQKSAKTAPVVVQKSIFDGTVVVLKKQLSDIEKAKTTQQSATVKIEKELASLTSKSDSVYSAAKAEMKSIYDKAYEKITAQEQALQKSKDKLIIDYQDALKALEEAKGVPTTK